MIFSLFIIIFFQSFSFMNSFVINIFIFNNFLEFSERFKPVKKLYLTSTYRNSQELIKVAGSFVMENNRQIKKQLISNLAL